MSQNYLLEDLLRDTIGKPVVWGVDDCVLFAADASLLQIDRDPIAPWRDAWSSRIGALKLVASKGGNLLDALANVAAELGHREISPDEAQPGDMGAILENDTPTAACRIEQGWLVRNERGFSVRQTAVKAWSIAHA